MKVAGKKILLIGPYPPPEGGVSIHLQRLMRKSVLKSGPDFAVFDVGKKVFIDKNENRYGFFSALRFFLSCSVVHLHISHPVKAIIGRIVKLSGKKLFYTQHNSRTSDDSSTKKIMKLCDKIIFVYNDKRYPERLVIPAYIPVNNYSSLSAEIENLVSGRRVIVTIGTAPVSQRDSDDVYGFDVVLKSIERITGDEKLLFLFIDVNGTFEERYKRKIAELQSKSSDLIELKYLSAGIDFPSLLKRADVYIRATKSDGDSIAVREALNSGTRVVSSDCVERPKGCILFKSTDADDLALNVSQALKLGSQVFGQEDYSERLFALYEIDS